MTRPASTLLILVVLAVALTPAVMSSQPRRDPYLHRETAPDRRHARSLEADAPRLVRTIYFLPSDRPYRADRVDRLQRMIQHVQRVFRVQMDAHGHGERTFAFEADHAGNPLIHRFDAAHPESHYSELTWGTVLEELETRYDFHAQAYIVVVDNSTELIEDAAGIASRWSKVGGIAMVPSGVSWYVLAHELGHVFGLEHDFRDGAYIMSYGPGEERLAACSARYLAVHPYFNPDASGTLNGEPTVALVSSDQSSINLLLNDSDGLHQTLLYVASDSVGVELNTCCGFADDQSTASLSFNWDGVLPSLEPIALTAETPPIIIIESVDTDGNSTWIVLESDEQGGWTQLTPPAEPPPPPAALTADPDINRDGAVNISDLVLVASNMGDGNTAGVGDANRDGVVDIRDLVLVANAID